MDQQIQHQHHQQHLQHHQQQQHQDEDSTAAGDNEGLATMRNVTNVHYPTSTEAYNSQGCLLFSI